MAHKALLTIEDKTYNLLECVSVLRQKTDSRGRPSSEVRGGNIQFSVIGTDDDLLTLWATDKTKKMDGKIALYEWDLDTKFKEISFKNAYVISFSESYMADPERDVLKITHAVEEHQQAWLNEIHRIHDQFKTPYIFLMRISAEQINIDGIDHHNNW